MPAQGGKSSSFLFQFFVTTHAYARCPLSFLFLPDFVLPLLCRSCFLSPNGNRHPIVIWKPLPIESGGGRLSDGTNDEEESRVVTFIDQPGHEKVLSASTLLMSR